MNSPLGLLKRFWLKARSKKDATADYFLLASVDLRRQPHVRTILIKTLSLNGIGFVTNKTGPKVWQFKHSQRVEGCMVWPKLTLQVRVAGKVRPMPKKTVQRLWRMRPREAQLLYHLGLKQSSPIPSFAFLIKKVRQLEEKWKQRKQIPLASNYVGFILQPSMIEFLHHNPTRLNRRELYQKAARGWTKQILAP